MFFGWDGDKAEIYSPDEGFPGSFTAAPRTVDEARAVFARRRSIADLVEAFDLRRRDLPKFLAGIEVSLDDEVCRNRAQGMSFAEIAKLQKTSAAKIRRILKQRGFEIRPGNTLKNEPSDAELGRAKAAGKSVNRVAKEFGIHWKTAKRRLDALA
ncbi:hypothetical protein [uncultured Jannaschia sp.]|uniref:hypothetical protein n=1 Tax=uncultured Jannaschia sp. TaxID=293347 RepID=UPI00262EFA96|nr:hypothetical protein [uncultured Jannaschia sp.]